LEHNEILLGGSALSFRAVHGNCDVGGVQLQYLGTMVHVFYWYGVPFCSTWYRLSRTSEYAYCDDPHFSPGSAGYSCLAAVFALPQADLSSRCRFLLRRELGIRRLGATNE
jgi:hypothetical protein